MISLKNFHRFMKQKNSSLINRNKIKQLNSGYNSSKIETINKKNQSENDILRCSTIIKNQTPQNSFSIMKSKTPLHTINACSEQIKILRKSFSQKTSKNRNKIKLNQSKLEDIKNIIMKNQSENDIYRCSTKYNITPQNSDRQQNHIITIKQCKTPTYGYSQQIKFLNKSPSQKKSDLNIIIKNNTENNFFTSKNYSMNSIFDTKLNNIQMKYQNTQEQQFQGQNQKQNDNFQTSNIQQKNINISDDINAVNDILIQYAKNEQINSNIFENITQCISLIFNSINNQLQMKINDHDVLNRKFNTCQIEKTKLKQQLFQQSKEINQIKKQEIYNNLTQYDNKQMQDINKIVDQLMIDNKNLQNYIKEQDECVNIYKDKESKMIKLLLVIQKQGVDIDNIYNNEVLNKDLDESDIQQIQLISKNKKIKILEQLQENASQLADQSILSESQEMSQFQHRFLLSDTSIIKAEYIKNFDSVIENTKSVIQNPMVKEKLQLNLSKVKKITSSSSEENSPYNVVQNMGLKKKKQKQDMILLQEETMNLNIRRQTSANIIQGVKKNIPNQLIRNKQKKFIDLQQGNTDKYYFKQPKIIHIEDNVIQ